jgi:hypothetical protein
MFSRSTVTKEYLQGLAQAATTDFLSNGTPLTEAVVKQASACGADLTAEHVRRICEMTYHDTYERMHKQASSADRYIVFDPPDAQVAAEILNSEKVASAPKSTHSFRGGVMTEKTASAGEARRGVKFQPANAFDQVVKYASTDHGAELSQAQGMHDLKRIHDSLKEASAAIEADLRASETALLAARQELSKIAYATVKEGAAVEDILHAGFSGVDWNSVSQESATKVASDLSAFLMQKERTTTGFRMSKTASYGDVNSEHALPAAFSKVASIEENRVHLEIALDTLKYDLQHANDALVSSLFGEKTGSAASLLRAARDFGNKAVKTSQEHPVRAGVAGAAAVAGAIGAAHRGGLLNPRKAPGGKE